MLFDIAREKGPLAAVSPETDREVKPVLCGQQGIITFPCGAPAPQQLSHIEERLKSDCTHTQQSNCRPHVNIGNHMCTHCAK